VDEIIVGITPLMDPVLLAKGEHVIVVSKDGFESEEKNLTLDRGQTLAVNFNLAKSPLPVVPIAKPIETQVSTAPQPEKKSRLTPLFWTGLAGTVVMGGVSGAMWGVAAGKANDYNSVVADMGSLTKKSDYDETQDGPEYDRLAEDANGYKNDMEKFQKIALGTSIATGVFAVLAVVGVAVDFNSKSDDRVEVSAAPGGVKVRF
jgi:hypothetical protein